jgi:hypothetical protein
MLAFEYRSLRNLVLIEKLNRRCNSAQKKLRQTEKALSKLSDCLKAAQMEQLKTAPVKIEAVEVAVGAGAKSES